MAYTIQRSCYFSIAFFTQFRLLHPVRILLLLSFGLSTAELEAFNGNKS